MATPVDRGPVPPASNPGPTALLHGLTSGAAGVGLVAVSFLAAIPRRARLGPAAAGSGCAVLGIPLGGS